jgi:hypothetical protein
VEGPVRISGTSGSVAIVDADIVGPVALRNNATGAVEPIVAGSTVEGPLACSGNSPAPINLGAPNDVTGPAAGQCAALD